MAGFPGQGGDGDGLLDGVGVVVQMILQGKGPPVQGLGQDGRQLLLQGGLHGMGEAAVGQVGEHLFQAAPLDFLGADAGTLRQPAVPQLHLALGVDQDQAFIDRVGQLQQERCRQMRMSHQRPPMAWAM